MEAEVGLNVMDWRTAGAAVTVSTAAPLVTLPEVAVMFVLPAATPVAKPAVTLASAGTDEAQVTPEDKVCVVLLL
jgi:hypothetical protein